MKSVPGSTKQYTQAQIDDPFNPPDWFPERASADAADRRAWRAAAGGARLRAVPSAHRATAIRNPPALPGLPADYIVRQMAVFKTGQRANAARRRHDRHGASAFR